MAGWHLGHYPSLNGDFVPSCSLSRCGGPARRVSHPDSSSRGERAHRPVSGLWARCLSSWSEAGGGKGILKSWAWLSPWNPAPKCHAGVATRQVCVRASVPPRSPWCPLSRCPCPTVLLGCVALLKGFRSGVPYRRASLVLCEWGCRVLPSVLAPREWRRGSASCPVWGQWEVNEPKK